MAEINDTSINLRLPTSLKRALQRDADAAGLSLLSYVRMVLKKSTDEREQKHGE